MKRNTLLLYTLISFAFILGSTSSNEFLKDQKNNPIRPNVSDIANLVKPMIQAPYRPEEVDSLFKEKKKEEQKENNVVMNKAEILGSVSNNKKGLVEKPTIYESIITNSSTSVLHKNPENNVMLANVGNSLNHLSINEAIKLAKGEVAIPVQLNTNNLVGTPGFETPFFLSNDLNNLQSINEKLAACSKDDIAKLNKKLSTAHTFKQRLNALKSEKERLKNDSKQITNKISQKVNELLKAKKVGARLNVLLNKYTVKLQKDNLKKIKKIDNKKVKKELKAKILKDIKGLRSESDQYTQLGKLDTTHLKKIVSQIKKKLKN